MSNATIILRAALARFHEGQLVELAEKSGVPRATVIRASNGARGRTTRADHHLNLCAFIGVDPVTGAAVHSLARVPRSLHLHSFAVAVKMSRMRKGHGVVEAAKTMGIGRKVLWRIESGQPVSIDCYLAACAYGGLDPLHYVVSRASTGNMDRVAA